jgi:hypothetical protein
VFVGSGTPHLPIGKDFYLSLKINRKLLLLEDLRNISTKIAVAAGQLAVLKVGQPDQVDEPYRMSTPILIESHGIQSLRFSQEPILHNFILL